MKVGQALGGKLIALCIALASGLWPEPPALAQEINCAQPNMLIVLDRSLSMDSLGKWTTAQTAIGIILDDFGPEVRYGLMLFPMDNNCGPGEVLVDIADNSEEDIKDVLVTWRPGGNTPMMESLVEAAYYAPLSDPEHRNFVMLITDGQDTCTSWLDPTPVDAVEALAALGISTFVVGFGSGVDRWTLNAMAQAGGTAKPGSTSYYQADNEDELYEALLEIVALISGEMCDGLDNNCNGLIDENDPGGGLTCDTGIPGSCAWGVTHCVDGAIVCQQASFADPEWCDGLDNNCDGQVDENDPEGGGWCHTGGVGVCGDGVLHCVDGEIVCQQARPSGGESCDGLDNDCDGEVDEGDLGGGGCNAGVPGPCGQGVIVCVGGRLECDQVIDPEPEKCDGIDNDCDGEVDEGVINACGGCAVGPDETCNGEDDDCDGEVDEGDPGGGEACHAGLGGHCDEGVMHCVGGELTCVPQMEPSEEICDGLDNDCDGEVDEGDLDSGGVCATGLVGACAEGTWICDDGLECQGLAEPTDEVCDYKDNDCDGLIDEEVSNPCGTCEEMPQEVCDGLDNDCDGEVDQGEGLCPMEQVCYKGHCVSTCPFGECFQPGHRCTDEYLCIDPCLDADCPKGWDCEAGSGVCQDPCEGVSCDEGQACHLGFCVEDSCYTLGCPAEQFCQGGDCVADPCAGLTCPQDTFCRGGDCITSCAHVACALDQRCLDGACVDDPCFGVDCWEGSVCDGGDCVSDPCKDVSCPVGRPCQEGECADDPCLAIVCPAFQECKNGQCYGTWQIEEPDGGEEPAGPDGGVIDDPDGGAVALPDIPYIPIDPPFIPPPPEGGPADDDGCGCALAGPGPSPWPLAIMGMLGLLALLGRRRD